jgi:hypothetical protein
MNTLLAKILEANIWFLSKNIDASKKKFQMLVHHHENVVRSAQHHQPATGALPRDALYGILSHTQDIAHHKNQPSFVNYLSNLFKIETTQTTRH